MTQVNLLPPDVRNKHKIRRFTAAAVGAIAAVVVLLLMVFVLQSSRLASANSELAAQASLNDGLQGKISALHHFQDLQDLAVSKQDVVSGLTARQVQWSDTLRSISASTPDGVWFTSISGVLNDTPTGEIVGTIQFQGKALNHRKIAEWLTTVEKIHGWENAWVSSSAEESGGTGGGGTTQVTFSGSIDLSLDATTNGRAR